MTYESFLLGPTKFDSFPFNIILCCLCFHILSGKQRNVSEYYENQERLLEGFNEMEAIHQHGVLPKALTEVAKFHIVFSFLHRERVIYCELKR